MLRNVPVFTSFCGLDNGDHARLLRVPEMMMAAGHTRKAPPVAFELSDDLTA